MAKPRFFSMPSRLLRNPFESLGVRESLTAATQGFREDALADIHRDASGRGEVGPKAPAPAYGYPTPPPQAPRYVEAYDASIACMLSVVKIVINITKPPSRGLPLLSLCG